MNFAICPLAAAPVRKEPSHRSEMVNQLLFGETLEILEEKNEWVRVRSSFDQYEGWLTHHLIMAVDEQVYIQPSRFVTMDLLSVIHNGHHNIHVSVGSSLTGFTEEERHLWNKQYSFEGNYVDTAKSIKKFSMSTAIKWINTPYLWGGKTFLGVDCSGFVQTLYKVHGVQLKRDAWQQQEQGLPVDGFSSSRLGDVAFFHNEQGRVVHVGIVLENNNIIHASGTVRVDELDSEGIMNVEMGKRTHQLHSIRRMLV